MRPLLPCAFQNAQDAHNNVADAHNLGLRALTPRSLQVHLVLHPPSPNDPPDPGNQNQYEDEIHDAGGPYKK